MRKITLILVLFIISHYAHGSDDTLPRWELGVSLAGITLPEYRAAKKTAQYLLPLPYANYRGERWRIGRSGIKGLIFDTERVDLDISLFGSPPVTSASSGLRQGMDDLDATLEIGPSLSILLYRSISHKTSLKFNLPLRAIFASDLKYFDHHGWILYPHLSLLRRQPPHGRDWNLSLSIGPLFANDAYHDFFFGVDQQDVTPQRHIFQGSQGYSGSRLIFSYRRNLTPSWIFRTFFQYENLSGAVFHNSPLASANETIAAGVLITKVFKYSKERVALEE